jgi:hypothetical protein
LAKRSGYRIVIRRRGAGYGITGPDRTVHVIILIEDILCIKPEGPGITDIHCDPDIDNVPNLFQNVSDVTRFYVGMGKSSQ